MGKKTRLGLIVAIALSHSTAAICQGPLNEPEIRFRLTRNSMIVISLVANAQGPFDFILDTGADLTILDPSLADRLSLVPLRETRQSTLAGSQTLRVGVLTSLSVGQSRVDNLPVMIQDLSGLRMMLPQVKGILGQDFFSHFNYLLDYRRRSLRIERDREIISALDGDPLQMETGGNRMIVETKVDSGGMRRLRLILDSGANSVVLMSRASEALPHPKPTFRTALTSSGPVALRMGTMESLTVGTEHLHDVAVALTAIHAEEQVGDGLLPTTLFDVLYVNNREGFVVLNPRRKKK